MGFKRVLKGMLSIGILLGSIAGTMWIGNKSTKREKKIKERYNSYYMLTKQWMLNKSRNIDLTNYFKKNNITCIAIYGIGSISELLYEEIKETDIKIVYFIDKKAKDLYEGFGGNAVISPEEIDKQAEVDAIIITPIFDFEEISKDLKSRGVNARIVSLEDIVYGE